MKPITKINPEYDFLFKNIIKIVLNGESEWKKHLVAGYLIEWKN